MHGQKNIEWLFMGRDSAVGIATRYVHPAPLTI